MKAFDQMLEYWRMSLGWYVQLPQPLLDSLHEMEFASSHINAMIVESSHEATLKIAHTRNRVPGRVQVIADVRLQFLQHPIVRRRFVTMVKHKHIQ
jgi:hypothetical protein